MPAQEPSGAKMCEAGGDDRWFRVDAWPGSRGHPMARDVWAPPGSARR
jgi:hypothetical protein